MARVARARMRTRWRYGKYLVGQSTSIRIGLVILGCYVIVAMVASIYTPHDPYATFVGPNFTPPGANHWFGTDRLGADVFSRTIKATALDLRITFVAVGLAAALGVTVGTVSGYAGGFVDFVLMRILEVIQSIPTLLVALIVLVAVGRGEMIVIVVLAVVGFPYYARLVRADMLSKRTWPIADSARLVGCSSTRVAFRHLLPNSLGPLVSYASVNAAWTVLVAASLGFVGVGMPPGEPEWGSMIARGQPQLMTGHWWISLFPGLAILGLTGSLFLIGDGISDLLDPRNRT